MQRAAASTPASPSTPEQPSPKRRKTGDSSPVGFNVQSLTDQRAVQIALAEEEAKRQAALDKQAAEAGDTRWILNFEPDFTNGNGITKSTLDVVPAGFAAIDKVSLTSSYEASVDLAGAVGRKSFGKFNRVIEVPKPSVFAIMY